LDSERIWRSMNSKDFLFSDRFERDVKMMGKFNAVHSTTPQFTSILNLRKIISSQCLTKLSPKKILNSGWTPYISHRAFFSEKTVAGWYKVVQHIACKIWWILVMAPVPQMVWKWKWSNRVFVTR
jgi:hypothetical protein